MNEDVAQSLHSLGSRVSALRRQLDGLVRLIDGMQHEAASISSEIEALARTSQHRQQHVNGGAE